jgi:hypothetical protein
LWKPVGRFWVMVRMAGLRPLLDRDFLVASERSECGYKISRGEAIRRYMSGIKERFGQKQTKHHVGAMSALPPKEVGRSSDATVWDLPATPKRRAHLSALVKCCGLLQKSACTIVESRCHWKSPRRRAAFPSGRERGPLTPESGHVQCTSACPLWAKS